MLGAQLPRSGHEAIAAAPGDAAALELSPPITLHPLALPPWDRGAVPQANVTSSLI